MSNDTTKDQPEADSGALFRVGDRVTWMHATSNGKSLGFSTRRGVIVELGKITASVKMGNNKRAWVRLANLRHVGKPTELTEMVQEMGKRNSELPQPESR